MRVLTSDYSKLYFGGMAKQAGDIFIKGTIDNLTFYKMDEKYYVRKKSSLTGKKFWKHTAFEGSRESCRRFSEGNQLASRIYRRIEKEKRVYSLYCFLKNRAIQLLKEGKHLKEAEELLVDYLRAFGFLEIIKSPSPTAKEITCVKCNCRNVASIDSKEERAIYSIDSNIYGLLHENFFVTRLSGCDSS